MLNSGRIVRLTRNQMLPVRRGEGCFKVEKRKVNLSDAWFRVSPLSLSLSLWVGVSSLRVSSPFFWSFIVFLSSDRIKFGFLCFLPQRSRIGRKITFNYLYFLTNFIDISLCAEALFSILKKVSAPIISGECYSGR